MHTKFNVVYVVSHPSVLANLLRLSKCL